ncbi:MAG: hypothetical protein ACTSPB_13695 [Candidatus Thorarchaeota archaeon]
MKLYNTHIVGFLEMGDGKDRYEMTILTLEESIDEATHVAISTFKEYMTKHPSDIDMIDVTTTEMKPPHIIMSSIHVPGDE